MFINSEIKTIASLELQEEINKELLQEDKSMASILEQHGSGNIKHNSKSIKKDVSKVCVHKL